MPLPEPTGQAGGEDWPERLRREWPGAIEWDSPMARRCTLRVGGPARAVALPATLAELVQLASLLGVLGIPWRVIGRGSNLLVADAGFEGVLVVLDRRFGAIERRPARGDGMVPVRVEAGCGLMRLVNWCSSEGLTGLEFAAGIPGSLGGAVVMNAGAWGGEMSERIGSVCFVGTDGSVEWVTRDRLEFGYRYLATAGRMVAAAEFLLKPGAPSAIEAACRDLLRRRKERQPQRVASAGSFFKNPAGLPAAGRLIEECGLKGSKVGGAQVSPVHANFLVNTGGATAQDFLDLMRLVQERVSERFGVWLEPEVRIIGTAKERA
ncbi:MAG: UDP-N-acetylmuramate dehydrogenase [Thermodesulfobacteriota bacterium]